MLTETIANHDIARIIDMLAASKFLPIKVDIASFESAAVMRSEPRRFLAIAFFTGGAAAGAAALPLVAFGAAALATALPLAAFGAAALAADTFPLAVDTFSLVAAAVFVFVTRFPKLHPELHVEGMPCSCMPLPHGRCLALACCILVGAAMVLFCAAPLLLWLLLLRLAGRD